MKIILGLWCVILLNCQLGFAKPAIIGGTRCVNMWDEGCINGQLPGAGNDDDYLNGGFNPGKRCLNVWDEDCHNVPMAIEGDENRAEVLPPGRRFLYQLLEQMRKKHQLY